MDILVLHGRRNRAFSDPRGARYLWSFLPRSMNGTQIFGPSPEKSGYRKLVFFR
jgi:hypothetical protein